MHAECVMGVNSSFRAELLAAKTADAGFGINYDRAFIG